MKSFYPVVQVANPVEVAQAFVDHFGFEETFSADWYVSLRNGAHELGVLDATHETIPEGFRTECRGVLLNVEVDDATAHYARLQEAACPFGSLFAMSRSGSATSSSKLRAASSST